jgi:hypothetical protein
MQQPVFFMYLQGGLVVITQYREKSLCIHHSSFAYVTLNFLHDFTFSPALLNCMGKVNVAMGHYNTAVFCTLIKLFFYSVIVSWILTPYSHDKYVSYCEDTCHVVGAVHL